MGATTAVAIERLLKHKCKINDNTIANTCARSSVCAHAREATRPLTKFGNEAAQVKELSEARK